MEFRLVLRTAQRVEVHAETVTAAGYAEAFGKATELLASAKDAKVCEVWLNGTRVGSFDQKHDLP